MPFLLDTRCRIEDVSPSELAMAWKTKMLLPGDMVVHRSYSWVFHIVRLSQFLSLLDWFNDKEKGNERGGPVSVHDAWWMAGFGHISDIDFLAPQIAEMTSKRARFRQFHELRGEHLLILRPKVYESAALKASKTMHEMARRGDPYPRNELVANTRILSKWLRKLLGHKRFDELFNEEDLSVCSGSYVEALIGSQSRSKTVRALMAHDVTHWSPVMLALLADDLFEFVMFVNVTDE